MYAVILFLLATPSSEPFPPGYHDRPGVSDDGTPVIVRTGLWDDFNGGKAAVEQVLIPNEDGSFTYQYDRQSRATRMYHATLCWFQRMYPPGGESTFSGPGTYGGWSCSLDSEIPTAALPHPTEPPS